MNHTHEYVCPLVGKERQAFTKLIRRVDLTILGIRYYKEHHPFRHANVLMLEKVKGTQREVPLQGQYFRKQKKKEK